MSIGERIKQLRESAGLNQRDFATRLGTASGRISQIEQNKNVPGGDFLLRLHQEFGVDLTWVLTGASTGGTVPAEQVNPRQAALLDNFEHLSENDKKALERTAFALAQSAGSMKTAG